MTLEELRELYHQLKPRYDAREITVDQFRTEMLHNRIQDSQGRYWMIDPESGNWVVNAGGAWIEGTPPAELSGGSASAEEEAPDWLSELRPSESSPEDEPLPIVPSSSPPVAPMRRKGMSNRSMVWILVVLFILLVLVLVVLGAVLTNGFGIIDLGL
jgi:hypothetical protein